MNAAHFSAAVTQFLTFLDRPVRHTWAKTLPNHSHAYFFYAPYQSCKFGGLWIISRSLVAAFFFDRSVRNEVQAHFKISSQLVFLMLPTSPASLVDFGAF